MRLQELVQDHHFRQAHQKLGRKRWEMLQALIQTI